MCRLVRLSSPRTRGPRLVWMALSVTMLSAALVTAVATSPARADSIGWVSVCGFVRHRMVDPIVYPGQPGAGHLHDFYGSTRVNATSSAGSLRRGGTSCAIDGDTAAYWAPALDVAGHVIRPRAGTFYYRNLVHPTDGVRPFPPGLKVIAGDPHAMSRQRTDVLYFGCTTLGGADPPRDHPVDCGSGWVTAHVNFPDCWDGTRIDSVDHQRHMAYSIDPNGDDIYRCPRSHPVPVPRLIYAFEWPVHDGTQIAFASGSYVTFHADFWNAWRQPRLRGLVVSCIHAQIDCGKIGT
jgi:hypothetical protein